MDRLLSKKRRGPITLSSSGIPDQTGSIRVGADDMLINALNRMTRTSRAYVFLDQDLISEGGLIGLMVEKKNPPRPSYYLRGSISQVDADVAERDVSVSPDHDVYDSNESTQGTLSTTRQLEVVSVDLHLVQYPSRRVVPGASVSNSMVVRKRSWGVSAYGLINVTGIDASLQIDRIESPGQAVRNLIEVGLIELIGRHAGVPFWNCLAVPETNAQANSIREHSFQRRTETERVTEAQVALIRLGRLGGTPSGRVDTATRSAIASFQAHENLLVNGIVDFDTWQRLMQRVAVLAVVKPDPKPAMQREPSVQASQRAGASPLGTSKPKDEDDGWHILHTSEAQQTQPESDEGNYAPLDSFLPAEE
ncbi:MAG: peptidoglycan-binding domain-containing protein [Pseudomonadota bacterium]